MIIHTIIYIFSSIQPLVSAKHSKTFQKPSNRPPEDKKQVTALTALTTPDCADQPDHPTALTNPTALITPCPPPFYI
jgi:hypothetical protein